MKIEIARSARRRRTVGARLAGDTMHVKAPAGMPENKLAEIIEGFQKRFERQKLRKALNREQTLNDIFERLNKKYFTGNLSVKSIKYVTNQRKKYGCCNFRTKTIRISHILAEMPEWVRDYVVVHEMAHLIEPNHSKAFWDIAHRYKLAERARGYLMAKGMKTD
ncbi:M48 family metallopeptidase [bacterium]|nr:M48 family metallopeptidase [bacterium]MBU3956050.1 M48 family metallopeptidase [bacterium]